VITSRDLDSTLTRVAFFVLDKAFYVNYLCLLASNNQQINWEEVNKATEKLENQKAFFDCAQLFVTFEN